MTKTQYSHNDFQTILRLLVTLILIAAMFGALAPQGARADDQESDALEISVLDRSAEIESKPLDSDQVASILGGGYARPFLAVAGAHFNEYGQAVAQTSDGGAIVAGYTDSYGLEDFLLMKYASDGALSWARVVGGSGINYAYDLAQTGDGGYIVAGYSSYNTAGGNDVLLVKFTEAGAVSWAKSAGGTADDHAYAVAVTSDGGYIVAGYTKSFGASGEDAFTLKYASDGTLSWAKTAGGSQDESALDVTQMPDGGYIVAGMTEGYGEGQADIFLLKYTSAGMLSWARTAGGANNDHATAIQPVSEGGFIVAGYTSSYGMGSEDVFLLKYTDTGLLSWARTAGGGDYDYAYDVAQTSDGGYIVAGQTYSYGAGGYDALLLKYAANGALAWSKTIGGVSAEKAYAVAQTSDGGYLLAGYSSSYGFGDADMLLAKTNPNGEIPGCAICATASPTTYTPTVGVSTATVATGSPSLFTATQNPGLGAHTIESAFLCGSKPFMTVSGDGDENGYGVVQSRDGGYAVAGVTSNYGAGGNDVLLLKYDAHGQLAWARTAGGSENDQAFAMGATSDGGYLLAGVTSSFGSGSFDILLLRYTSDGTLSWASVAGGAGYDRANGLLVTTNNYSVVVGHTNSYGAGGYDAIVLRYKSDGTLSWAKTAGGSGTDRANAVAATSDYGYIVAGETASYGAGGNDILLLKYESDGTLSWAKTAGGTGADIASAVAEDEYGIYLAGRTDSYGAGDDDAFYLKFNSLGDFVRARVAGGPLNDNANAMIIDLDYNYILAGKTESFGAGDYDAWLLKYVPGGDFSWAKTTGGGDYDVATNVSQAVDGGFTIAGFSESYRATGNDLFLLKTNPDGDLPGCDACTPVSPTLGSVTPVVSSQTVAESSPSITLALEMFTTSAPSPGHEFLCGWPFDILLPLAYR